MKRLKKDKYLRVRGGTAQLLDITCAACESLIFQYQKDGPGYLRRCYLNRIEGNNEWAKLKDNTISAKKLPALICCCGAIIGHPIVHSDGRVAYHMELGKFRRKQAKAS